MNDKKKLGLVKRIAAGVFALMIVVGCFGSEAYYAATLPSGDESCSMGHAFQQEVLLKSLEPIPSDAVLPVSTNGYDCCIVFCGAHGSKYYYFVVYTADPILLDTYYAEYTGSIMCGVSQKPDFSTQEIYYCSVNQSDVWHSNAWNLWTNTSASNVTFLNNSLEYFTDTGETRYNIYQYRICYSNYDLCCVDTGKVLLYKGFTLTSPGSYNSSIGYLQNIKRQTLYLENDAFSPIDETLKYQFTFDKTTTTGLDITDGNWSVRHYMQVEVKNAKKDYETVEIYDKVQMGEYSASSCKVGYMFKDIAEKLHEESGFDGLSWWESNGLGYITYYNDYFQLVRTNEDGSVEYGGFVKVWQDEYNINHSTTLGEDESQDDTGYNDNIVSGSHGSGGTYDEAEHDADENASNSSNADSELIDQVGDIVSTVMAVPEIFARMFSFLPDWCLNFLGISVALSAAIIVWKVGRG